MNTKETKKQTNDKDLSKLFRDVTSKMSAVAKKELSLTSEQLADVTNKTLVNLGYSVTEDLYF